MSSAVETEDQMGSKQPMVGKGAVRMVLSTGDSQVNTHKCPGAGHCWQVDTQKPLDKKATRQIQEKRGREKGDMRGRPRGSSGWRAQLLNCFACGAVNQDEHEQLEKTGQKPQNNKSRSGESSNAPNSRLGESSNAPKEGKTRDKTVNQHLEGKEPRARIALSAAPSMTEDERRKGRMKAYKAYLQKFLKLRKDDRMRKKAYKHIQRKRREVEANQEWSTLHTKAEEAERKVAFNDVHLCDVWYYEEEAVPSQRCLRWMRILDEIRHKKRMEEEEDLARRAGQEECLKESEEEQLVLLRPKACIHSDAPKVLLVLRPKACSHSDAPKVLLMVAMALCVFLWFCSLKYRGFCH